MEKKSNLGRQKVKMAKMENDSNLQVTFSKRRSGLFKKASELCTLCGAEVGIVVFSPGKKVSSFGHPDIEKIIDRYLNHNRPENNSSGASQLIEAHRNANIHQLNMQLTQLVSEVNVEKRRGEELSQMRKASQNQHWWEAPIEELSPPQLRQLKSALEELKKNVAKQADKLLVVQSTNANNPYFMGGSSSASHVFPTYYENNNNNNNNNNVMPQGYNGLNMNLIPSGYNLNIISPEGYNPNYPQGYTLCPPDQFGRGFL